MVLLVAGLYACGDSSEQESGSEGQNEAIRTATQSLVMPQDLNKVPGMLKGLWEQTGSWCDEDGRDCDTIKYNDIVFMGKNCLVGAQRNGYEVSNDTVYIGEQRDPVQVIHITPSELVCNWVMQNNVMRYERRRRQDGRR